MGVAIAAFQTSIAAYVQKIAGPSMVGRAMTLLTLGWFGTTPLGALVAGWVADTWSARVAMAVAGAVPLLCAALLARRRGNDAPVLG
jgi:predicted MFS family arabinose efflux permease